jgi:NADH:ubiquinone oxidoreductase subunit 5 (subunit L)/multisubunit Na+/H+ antiporter MnhA subunit
MYLYVIFASLFNSILIGLFGKFLGRQTVIYISLVTLISSFIFSLIILYEILLNQNILIIHLYNLLIISEIKIDIGFLFDSLTAVMLFVVLGISSLVHIFTAGYMSHDPFIVRFYTFLGFFTFFMIILITADNFLQLFVG